MKKEYLERIYAGWLAKIIGIRYGAPMSMDFSGGAVTERVRSIRHI